MAWFKGEGDSAQLLACICCPVEVARALIRAICTWFTYWPGLVTASCSLINRTRLWSCMQSLTEHYREAGFLKTYGNVSEAAKYLFKERLKARVTPTFYFFRNGEMCSRHARLCGGIHNA